LISYRSPIVDWEVFPIPYNHYTTLCSKSQALFSFIFKSFIIAEIDYF
jgi:hypothetical protein